jgi:hypothetical protein
MISILIAGLFNPIIWGLLLLFCLIVFVDSSIQNKSIKIGLLSIVTSFTQLFGYGLGFLSRLK